MKSFFHILPAYFSQEDVNKLIFSAEKVKAEIALSGGIVNLKQRRSEVRWLTYLNEDFVSLFNNLSRLFHKVNLEHFGFDLSYLPNLQFTTYKAEDLGHFSWHDDIFWLTSNFYQRKLSLVIQLTDPEEYEGGEFEFAEHQISNREEFKKKGSVLIFPSFLRHRVTPVIKGTRKSLVAWMEGPAWR